MVGAFGSMLINPNVVVIGVFSVEFDGVNLVSATGSCLIPPLSCSCRAFDTEPVLRFFAGLSFSTGATFLLFAIGKARPRNFPLLATPTPHVKTVLYPEQSLPRSRHCVQYGLLLSQVVCKSWQAKQSSAAPVVGARLLFFRGEVGEGMSLVFDGGKGWLGARVAAIAVVSPFYARQKLSQVGFRSM